MSIRSRKYAFMVVVAVRFLRAFVVVMAAVAAALVLFPGAVWLSLDPLRIHEDLFVIKRDDIGVGHVC